ncbi:MAG: hypothetical protein ACTHNT_12975, partial [Actinomycetales bacterium]
VDARSGVSARCAVAAAESVSASALRRAALTGEDAPVARVCDLPAVVPTLRGKVEFEASEEGREEEILGHLLRRAIAETFRLRLGSTDLSPLLQRFEEGATVETGDLVPARDLLGRIGQVEGLSALLQRLDGNDGSDDPVRAPGRAAAALELALEGLYLTRKISKDEVPGRTVYGG